MAIYLPELVDKIVTTLAGLKANWEAFLAHVAAFEAHKAASPAEGNDLHGLLSGGFIIEESGSNDNGSYVRWSNGLQICWIPSITLVYVNTGLLRVLWTYPAAFKSGSTPAGFANPIGYAPVASARTAGTVVSCAASSCLVSASTPVGIFGEDDTWNFQVVAIGWWK